MRILNFTSNFLENSAKIIAHQIKNQCNPVIIVPEKSYILPLKNAILEEITHEMDNAIWDKSKTFPTIISIEGLNGKEIDDNASDGISNSVDEKANNKVDNMPISRNKIYAKVFELVSNAFDRLESGLENESDIATFTRSTIGEIPNLYANGVQPRDILDKIPANVAQQKEISLNLFVKVWEKLNVWLKQSDATPYYASQGKALEVILQHYTNDVNSEIFILHDFGRSAILRNLIAKTAKTNIKTTVFIQNYEKNDECFNGLHSLEISNILSEVPYEIGQKAKKFHSQMDKSEEKIITNIVNHCLHFSNDNKIGIICEDELLSKSISLELNASKILHQHNIATPIESNVFIKIFIALLENKPEKILPVLDIVRTEDNKINNEKKQILSTIISGNQSSSRIWYEIGNFLQKKKKITKETVESIFTFLEENKKYFQTNNGINNGTIATFFQFKHFLLNDIDQISIDSIPKNVILHIAKSWKIWEEKPVEKSTTSIKICNLRESLLQRFDHIILTSSFETKPSGNILFSEGMRKCYNFATIPTTGKILETLVKSSVQQIFFTGTTPPFEMEVLQIEEIQEDLQKGKKLYHSTIAIKKHEMPRTLSATQIEKLFENPLVFYYQYIKNLKEIPYRVQKSLEIGNTIHSILEKTTIEIIKHNNSKTFDFIKYANEAFATFAQGKFNGIKVFYIDKIIQILTEIAQITGRATAGTANKSDAIATNITVEVKNISVQIECCGEMFTLMAKPDRMDISQDFPPSSAIIYDYKTGSSAKFNEKSIEKMEKIQPIIPAMLFPSVKWIFGQYTFLEHSAADDVRFEITKEVIEKFKEKISEYVEKYAINGEILPNTGEMYAYFHVARV